MINCSNDFISKLTTYTHKVPVETPTPTVFVEGVRQKMLGNIRTDEG
jgi:hypothetical protein